MGFGPLCNDDDRKMMVKALLDEEVEFENRRYTLTMKELERILLEVYKQIHSLIEKAEYFNETLGTCCSFESQVEQEPISELRRAWDERQKAFEELDVKINNLRRIQQLVDQLMMPAA